MLERETLTFKQGFNWIYSNSFSFFFFLLFSPFFEGQNIAMSLHVLSALIFRQFYFAVDFLNYKYKPFWHGSHVSFLSFLKYLNNLFGCFSMYSIVIGLVVLINYRCIGKIKQWRVGYGLLFRNPYFVACNEREKALIRP